MFVQSHSHCLSFHPPLSLSGHRPSSRHISPFFGTDNSFSPLGANLLFRGRRPWLAQLPDTAAPVEDGPVQLPPSDSPLSFGDPAEASPIQVATSVLLTGAITVFLFRSLRRRAKRAKEMRVRSGGIAKKGLQAEALENLKAMRSASIEPGKPPSPVQALLGGLSAGVIALILYKFTTTIEASLNRQTISDNFSVRQITITIRTIINGLCYLATFVFGANSIGLILYSGQLALNSLSEDSPSEETSEKEDARSSTQSSSATNPLDNEETNKNDGQQSPGETQ
ncbi:hypothetical protein H6P81_013892 [Aristolochia fimbriata]|uniref:Transmembrane protein n=1 Tax=Aristolochia fimbriata TaxID=158543 RepID=A0AAV7EGF3_ARIFI|nr:hypothetical protein H6P81_013892 [Aristolochia fimbriata]